MVAGWLGERLKHTRGDPSPFRRIPAGGSVRSATAPCMATRTDTGRVDAKYDGCRGCTLLCSHISPTISMQSIHLLNNLVFFFFNKKKVSNHLCLTNLETDLLKKIAPRESPSELGNEFIVIPCTRMPMPRTKNYIHIYIYIKYYVCIHTYTQINNRNRNTFTQSDATICSALSLFKF